MATQRNPRTRLGIGARKIQRPSPCYKIGTGRDFVYLLKPGFDGVGHCLDATYHIPAGSTVKTDDLKFVQPWLKPRFGIRP